MTRNTYNDDPTCTPFTDSVGDFYGDWVEDPEGPRFWPALGNHDYEDKGAGLEKYRAYFTYLPTEADPQQRWYDVKVDGIHLFILDNDAPDADLAAQQVWLRERLTASRAQDPAAWNVVIFHKPAFTSASHPDEVEMRPDAGWDYRGWGADVVIARAIATRPDVLLMDEPCSALDPIATLKIEELMHQLAREFTVIIVTHNMQQAVRVSDFTAFLHLGKLIEFGETDAIFTNPREKLTESYLRGTFS